MYKINNMTLENKASNGVKIQGVIHMHSTYSYDGKENLLSLRDFLSGKGISFCCLTEHTDYMTVEQAQRFAQECKALSTGTFLFIPGFEVPYKVNAKGREGALGCKEAHILLIGTEVFLGQKADGEMLRKWSASSVLTILAHPVRNSFIVDEIMEDVLDGVEIWNQQYEGKRVPRVRSVRLLEKLQKKNPELLATGGLDFHRKDHFGSPLFTLQLPMLTSYGVLEALKKGMYTFGTDAVSVSSVGIWKGNTHFYYRMQSFASIAVIVCGKKVNAGLAYFGIKFPKKLTQLIRSRV